MKNISVPAGFFARYPGMSVLEPEILRVTSCLISCFESGGKLLVCGNGGSSSDSDHIAGELMKGFEHRRPVDQSFSRKLKHGSTRGEYLAGKLQQGFPVISLSAHAALLTAVANDIGPDLIFAQQVISYGKKGDVLLALSTSGNSQNVVDAILTAKAKEMTVIGMTGEGGGTMKDLCDILLGVPASGTAEIQELHLPLYHIICKMIEIYFFT